MSIRETLRSRWNIEYVELNTENKEPETEGFDFYIFERVSPKSMPKDGIVFFVNPENVPITVIPLYQSIYSTRKALISLDSISISISIPNFCSFFVDFENRSEFVNLLVLDQLVPVSTFYILGPNNEFISHLKAGMYQFQKFDRFSSESYPKVKIVTNSGVICGDPSLVSLSAVNNWKSNPWSYWFSPSDSIRIPLPLAGIYNYHVVTRNVRNRIVRSGYEVLRTQGVIVNKTKELVSESFRVRGVAHKRDSVLALLNCTLERVELDVSIRIESNLYDVMFRVESMPFQFARFALVDESENVFDLECSIDSSQCGWKVPISSSSLELMNPDYAIGELSFSHYFSFWVDSDSQNLILSSLESNSFKETVSGEIVFREYLLPFQAELPVEEKTHSCSHERPPCYSYAQIVKIKNYLT